MMSIIAVFETALDNGSLQAHNSGDVEGHIRTEAQTVEE